MPSPPPSVRDRPRVGAGDHSGGTSRFGQTARRAARREFPAVTVWTRSWFTNAPKQLLASLTTLLSAAILPECE